MLQERIETLGSGILEFKSNGVYTLGFNNIERLNDYYLNKKQCHCSQGIYPERDLNFGRTQDNALFILIKDNKEFKKFHFEVLLKDTVKYKNTYTKKWTSKVYKIRKCKYNNIYNFIVREKEIVNGEEIVFIESHNFKSLELLEKFFFKQFSTKLELNEFSQIQLNL